MTNYRTRFFDNQLHFGSGSFINANDIPNSATRFWLTNSLQAISGSKILANDLNLNSNKIINVTDPTSDQEAATKKYVDDNTGANTSATLDDVCDNGNTTDQDIKAQNFYINYDGADGDSRLYFYENSSATGASLMWDDSPGTFLFSHDVTLPYQKILYLTRQNGGRTGKIYMAGTGTALKIDAATGAGGTVAVRINGADKFTVYSDGNIAGEADFRAKGDFQSDNNFYVNYNGPDGDSYFYFYENSSTTGAHLKFDNADDRFEMNHALYVDSFIMSTDIVAIDNVYINNGGPDGDSYLYFFEDSSGTGASLKWDNGNSRFGLSHGLYIPSYIIMTGNFTTTGGSIDIQGGNLDVNGVSNLGDGGTTNYTEIKADGEIRLHGTAQTWEDLRIVPGAFEFAGALDPSLQNWQPGGSGTTFTVYKFKENDEAFFTCQLPHTYKEGSDIKAHIHWTPCDRGNEENGNTVAWKLDYSWANPGGVFSSSTTVDLSDACTGTDDIHEKAPTVAISGTDKNISSMLICRIWRDSVGDTWAGTTNAQSPALLEIDFHFEIDSLGSDLELTK